MAVTLREEIRQAAPFKSLHEEAFLNLARTVAALNDGLDRILGPHGLSQTQYNVLRMLRGAGKGGLCRNEIRDRLITRMPDVSRLLDRMEAAGLVCRDRSVEDRRLVNTTLTAEGRALVQRLDEAVAREHERLLGHMDERQLRGLVELLTIARSRP